MIKHLTQVGNSKALLIEKSILQAAGLGEDTAFQIIVDPNGGIIIQSLKPVNDQQHQKNVAEVIEKHKDLLKRLSNQ